MDALVSQIMSCISGQVADNIHYEGGRNKALCCSPNPIALKTLNCDADLCEDDEAACADESGLLDVEGDGYWSLVSKRSYQLRNGKIMYGYDRSFFEERGVLPGNPRSFNIVINAILRVSMYKDYVIWTRYYPPGLKVFNGDGSSTLSMRGGFR